MNDDVEKYIAHRKRTDKAFAKDFESGYAEFKRRQLGGMANALTARTLKASKAGRNVKRFGSKKELFADLVKDRAGSLLTSRCQSGTI